MLDRSQASGVSSLPLSGLENHPYYVTKDGHISKSALVYLPTLVECLCGIQSKVKYDDVGRSYIVSCKICETIFDVESAHA